MKKIFPVLFLLISFSDKIIAQDLSDIANNNLPKTKEFVSATFKGFRVINAQTNETAKKKNLFFDIAHRFGDIGGGNGGIHNFYGFDNSTDIRFSFDYGVTDNLQVGVGRSKGVEPYRELVDGNVKYKLLKQGIGGGMPFSLSAYGVLGISARQPSPDLTSDASFQKFCHRMSYVSQVIVARRFSSSFSFELVPTYTHRNYVLYNDETDMFSLGAGTRMKLTKRFAIIADYFHNFSTFRMDAKDAGGKNVFYDPLSVGVEIETGGHVFTINFTNATGILENSFLPETKSNWASGEFRLGFNISRNFVIGGKGY